MNASTTSPGSLRLAGLGALLTPGAFFVGVLLAASQFEGYSHISQQISELSGVEATMPWIQTMNFAVLAITVGGIAWALRVTLGGRQLGPWLLAYFSVFAAAGGALFPCDAGCATKTLVGRLHVLGGATGFVAAVTAMFLLRRTFRTHPQWATLIRPTTILASFSTIGLGWFVITQAAGLSSFAGLAQRIFVGSFLIWISIVGQHIHKVARTENYSLVAHASIS